MHPNTVVSSIKYDKSNSVPEIIHTPKIKLKSLKSDVNTNKLHKLFSKLSDPEEVFQYCSWNHHKTIQETKNYLQKKREHWKEGEKYEYIIINKENNEFIGTTYIETHSDDRAATLGLWIKKEFWGQNLQGRVGDIRLQLCFKELELEYVDIGCLENNEKSLSAISSFAHRYNGTYYGTPPVFKGDYDKDIEDNIVPHHEFYISRKQYMSEKLGINVAIPNIDWYEIDIL